MTCHTVLPPEGICPACSPVQPPVSASVAMDADTTAGTRFIVTVSGELDADSAQLLQHWLDDALHDAADGLELDLSGVEFCDCSTLNVLLLVRQIAQKTAKSILLRASSAAVDRLLELTHTRALFTGDASAGEDLLAENAQLHRALETRPAIDIARGILMASYTISAEQAWNVLVSTSQHSNTKLHLIAETLMNTVHGENLAEPFAGHLAQALQEHGSLPH